MIDRVKGRVMMTVRMQPGDLLYIPREYSMTRWPLPQLPSISPSG